MGFLKWWLGRFVFLLLSASVLTVTGTDSILRLLGRERVWLLDKVFRGAAFPLYLFNPFLYSKFPTFWYSWVLTLLFCYCLVPYSHWNLLSEERKKAAVTCFKLHLHDQLFSFYFGTGPRHSTFHVLKSQSISLCRQPQENFCCTSA